MKSSRRSAPTDRRAGRAAGIAPAILTLATVVGAATEQPASSFERALPFPVLALGLAGVISIAAAALLAANQRPHLAIGLAVASLGFLAPIWAGWAWVPRPLQANVVALAPLAVAGASHVGLGWRGGGGGALRATYALVIVAIVILLTAYNPLADPDCARTCADVEVAAAAAIPTRWAIGSSSLLTGAAAVLALVVTARRRHEAPRWIASAASVALGALAAASAVQAGGWAEPPAYLLQTGPTALAAASLGLGCMAAALMVRRARVRLEELVRRLATPGGDGAEDRGVRAVAFAVPGDERWVDAGGRPVEPEAARERTVEIADDAGPAIRVQMAAGDDLADVLAGLSPAAHLALRNARLSAVTNARLLEVQASRRRVVAASDAERARIERDLHDGAQQRLVSATFHLSLARNRLRDEADDVRAAERSVHEALAALRRISHGVVPSSLATDGLRAALEDLIGASDLAASVEVPDVELDAEAALAAFAAVATIVEDDRGAGRRGRLAISAATADGELTLRVARNGGPVLGESAITEITDRVGAIGGRVTVESSRNGSVLTAVLPCESS